MNEVDDINGAPIHWALLYDVEVKILEELLKYGANPNHIVV